MSAYDDLITVLKEQNKQMDINNKMSYLHFMKQQQQLENRTPTSVEFGTYGFNPTNAATQLAAWRQIVPRNNRRRQITITALNQTLFLTKSENVVGMSDLINWQQNGFPANVPVMIITFATGQGLQIQTTEAIYVASLTGAGSTKEQNSYISWAEEIYSNVSASPLIDNPMRHNAPGLEQRLTAGLVNDIDDEAEAHFTREGVR